MGWRGIGRGEDSDAGGEMLVCEREGRAVSERVQGNGIATWKGKKGRG